MWVASQQSRTLDRYRDVEAVQFVAVHQLHRIKDGICKNRKEGKVIMYLFYRYSMRLKSRGTEFNCTFRLHETSCLTQVSSASAPYLESHIFFRDTHAYL